MSIHLHDSKLPRHFYHETRAEKFQEGRLKPESLAHVMSIAEEQALARKKPRKEGNVSAQIPMNFGHWRRWSISSARTFTRWTGKNHMYLFLLQRHECSSSGGECRAMIAAARGRQSQRFISAEDPMNSREMSIASCHCEASWLCQPSFAGSPIRVSERMANVAGFVDIAHLTGSVQLFGAGSSYF